MRRNADQLQLDRRRRTRGTIAIATFALRRVAAWPGGGAPRYTLGRVCRCLIMPASCPAKEEALLIVTPEIDLQILRRLFDDRKRIGTSLGPVRS